MKLTSTMADNDAFLRELHHRVKNNFQIIASLINLQKRMLPTDRRDEARFVEEHVQSMAAAYRIVSVTDGMVQVALDDLVSDVVDVLRHIAGLGRDVVRVELPAAHCFVRIDQAVAMGLYLAVVVPPYLDSAGIVGGVLRIVVAEEGPERVVLSVAAAGGTVIQPEPLRQRLATAYLRQLSAEADSSVEPGVTRVRIRLQPLQATHFA
jgi:hypothetical protein